MIKLRNPGSLLPAVMMTVTAVLLSGCHGSRQTNEFVIPDEFDTGRHYDIVFWAKNDTNKTQTQIYNQAIADFEALYPNITVNMRLYTDYNKIYNDVITNISTGTTPNVCITYPDHIATYMTGDNVVVPLDGLMEDPRYGLGGSEVAFDSPGSDEIVPEFLDECRLGGSCYALPFMRSTEALYINKDYVNALGYDIPDVVTWDYVWEVSEAALAKNNDGTYALNGKDIMIPFIYKSTDNMLISMLKQQGAGYSDDSGNISLFNDTTESDLYTISGHVATGAFSTFKISGYPGNFFNAGECVFAVDSTAGATWMGSSAPLSDIHENDIVNFETVVRPIPQYDTSDPKMISQGPSICIFNKDDPQEVMASWLFAQYMLTNDVQIAYSSTEGYVPVTTKAQESSQYKDYLARAGEDADEHYDVKIAAAELLLGNMQNTFTTPVFNGSTALRNAAGQLIENVAKSTRRHETIDDDYMNKLYSDVESLYKLDQYGGASKDSQSQLGELPVASKLLILCIGASWMGIIVYFIVQFAKKKRPD
ncbi:MAG: extracellular solute-binding protein [Saccharofermentans sp.]|jgi:multiple sugar transport system substrate-binding protein|nr:extracellular solute-binding protein [Mageeibacillus sp.]MCI1263817.1 extracellular solute-binding protein [Saccharofermentans sp.]MCI1275067.1 extracellular solute-binding protein [Saccharofermentans sp.]MCI1769140.1 extracellular solute-binding protein [Mageeibacillus sp.]MCI2044310.1 extracellular solute-binding protein [Mageeibacillus sp.]